MQVWVEVKARIDNEWLWHGLIMLVLRRSSLLGCLSLVCLAAFFHLSRKELWGQSWGFLPHPIPQRKNAQLSLLGILESPHRLRTPDGESCLPHLEFFPIWDSQPAWRLQSPKLAGLNTSRTRTGENRFEGQSHPPEELVPSDKWLSTSPPQFHLFGLDHLSQPLCKSQRPGAKCREHFGTTSKGVMEIVHLPPHLVESPIFVILQEGQTFQKQCCSCNFVLFITPQRAALFPLLLL